MKRINKFMNCEELDPENVQHDPKECKDSIHQRIRFTNFANFLFQFPLASPLLIENGSFTWGEEETILKNIEFKVDQGKLAAVVGTVGSGKSSLLSALLGEMEKVAGRVNTVGKIAYVSQVSARHPNSRIQIEKLHLFAASVDPELYAARQHSVRKAIG